MSKFTVRVELHNATWTDYDTLHAAMAARGFSRQITSSDGKAYQLPLAEYNGTGNDCSKVRDIAREAANLTGKGNAVLVSEATSRAWSGLQPIG